MIPLLLLGLVCGLATAEAARRRGRNFAAWLIWGTLFAPFALPVVFVMPRR